MMRVKLNYRSNNSLASAVVDVNVTQTEAALAAFARKILTTHPTGKYVPIVSEENAAQRAALFKFLENVAVQGLEETLTAIILDILPDTPQRKAETTAAAISQCLKTGQMEITFKRISFSLVSLRERKPELAPLIDTCEAVIKAFGEPPKSDKDYNTISPNELIY